MKLARASFRVALTAAAITVTAGGVTPLHAQDPWQVSWKNSTRIESPDGDVAIKIGGRIQADFSFPHADTALERAFSFEDGTEFRRARLFVEGLFHERFELKAEYDFAGGATVANDVYVGLVGLPGVGGLRVGHFKEPFGLEALTSSKYTAFVERSLPMEAFAPSRNMGLMLHHQAGAADNINWALGAFKDVDDFGTALADEWNVTGRLTGVLASSDEDRRLLHLGASFSRRSPNDDTVRYRARPQSHLAPRIADTGSITAERATLLGLELAWLTGPFWLQGEWTDVTLEAAGDPNPAGYTVQAGWFLTGENRAYKRQGGVLDRVTPQRPWIRAGGQGAWEIAIRLSQVDLDSRGLEGGQLDGAAVAVNWYPTSFTRLSLNYTTTERDGAGTVDFVLVRFQVEF